MSTMTNQYPDLEFYPDISESALKRSLQKLLKSGSILDSALEQSCRKLSVQYRLLCSLSHEPLWAPGLKITPELRRQAELYLPLEEVTPVIHRLIIASCLYEPFLAALPKSFHLSWYDALSSFRPLPVSADPGRLIRMVAENEALRQQVLAALLNPVRYGGGFGRYRGQMQAISAWLKECLSSGRTPLRLLDAACGAGEQCYELAELLQALGITAERATIHGLTVEPLELVSAAHGWFPHDKERQTGFQHKVKPLLETGCGQFIKFVAGNIENPQWSGESYDLIICNGLIGGPLLHEEKRLEQVLRSLAGRLKKKGLLLLANRFHDGWRRKTPLVDLAALLTDAGLVTVECKDGLTAVRP